MAFSAPHSGNSEIPLHRPAMVQQVLDVLSLEAGDSVLDVTVGTGGHSLALARALGAEGLLVGMDADRQALEVAQSRLQGAAACDCRLFPNRFSRASEVAR
ncbi:MAG: 16S rRNA (cytosine(1402)-N(4))-methyltransferase, partial [Candidatus Brocadiaceae bacterium]